MTTSKPIQRKRWSEIPWSIKWRARLVQLPRHVPRPALRITSPEGPYPVVVNLPSRYSNHDITVWMFLPPENKLPKNTENVAVHIDFHGGNFFMGSPFEQAPFCAKLARERGLVVLSVDYCLGPLYQFPLALHDAEDVLSTVLDSSQATPAGKVLHSAIASHYLPRRLNHRKSTTKHNLVIDPTRLSFSGFSSGGNIAVNLVTNIPASENPAVAPHPSLIPKDVHDIPVLLFYPQLDTREDSYNRPAPPHVSRPGRFGTSLERRLMPTYMSENDRSTYRGSPGLVDPKYLHPKTHFFVVLAENDSLISPLNDWFDRVRKAGMGERLKVYRAPGMGHGFANLPERFLKTTQFRLKRQSYQEMFDFWDHVVEHSQVDRQDIRGGVDSRGFLGIGIMPRGEGI